MPINEYMKKIKILTEEIFIEILSIYDENTVIEYFKKNIKDINNSKIVTKEQKELLKQINYYLGILLKQKKLDKQEKLNSNKEKDQIINIENIYLKEIGDYRVLTKEEEQCLGKNLKLKPFIFIITNKFINNHEEPIIDLETIFSSITTIEEKNIIIEKLNNYYKTNYNQESESTKIAKKYLLEYKRLCQENKIPTIEELNNHFANFEKNKTFINYSKEKRLDSKTLLDQVDKYIKYMQARDTMIKHNLKLVIKLASKYSFKSNDLLDNINEGNVGLMIALEKFDSDKGYKFSTYATWWIKRSIIRAKDNTKDLIRIPSNQKGLIRKIMQIEEQHILTNGNLPTVEELSTILKISEKQVSELLIYKHNFDKCASLDYPLTEDAREPLINDILENQSIDGKENIDSYDNLIERINFEELMNILKQEMQDLSSRDTKIIQDYLLNIIKGKKESLRETAKRYNLSYEAVRRIQNKFKEKIKRKYKKTFY